MWWTTPGGSCGARSRADRASRARCTSRARRLDLRVVADSLEQRDVCVRHQLAIASRHVRPGDRVRRAVDQRQRHVRLLQRADPARPVLASLVDVADQPMHHVAAAVPLQQRPEAVDQRIVRRRARTEDPPHVPRERGTRRQPRDQRSERRAQQPLDHRGSMRLREQSAVQERDAPQLRTRARLTAPREQFLRDRIAVVVCEHVVRRDPVTREHVLREVRLLDDRVRVVARLRGQPEAEHVEREHAVPCGERRPHRFPVPRSRREAVDQQQRVGGGFTSLDCEDVERAERQRTARARPLRG